MKKLLCAAGTVAALWGLPAEAHADCGGGLAYNRLGEAAVFQNVSPRQGMNCASARYVVNKWLMRAYRRQYSNRIPVRFYDGYVTWHCYKLSRLRWRCNEFTSYTAFEFTAYRI